MASFFGEVIQTSSRTVDDDDDFDETLDSVSGTPQFELSVPSELRKSARLLVIADGHHASSFCTSFLLDSNDSEAVGTVRKVETKDEDDTLLGLRPRKTIPSRIYRLGKEALICVMSPDVSAHESYFFVTEVLELVQPSGSVAVLTSAPLVYFRVDDSSVDLNASLLRVLSTSRMSVHTFERLEQPNIVSGVPAAVLSRCEVRGVPAALSVVFTEFSDYDNSLGTLYSKFLAQIDTSRTLRLPSLTNRISKPSLATNTGNLYM